MDDLTLDTNLNEGLILDGPSRAYFKETAKWAKFLAIVGFVGVGMMFLMGIFVGSFMGLMMGDMAEMATSSMPSAFFTIYFFALGALGLMPCLYLFRFAKKMQLALAHNNQQECTESFMNLKSFFKFYGIVMAIIVGLYLLLILSGFLMSLFIG